MHLKDGCILNTTAEIILETFNDINFKRIFDKKTGYNELTIIEK